MPPPDRPGKPGLLGTGIFVGCLAGGFAGMSLTNDAKFIALYGVLAAACVIAGTVMVALGVNSRKSAWSAVGALLGFLVLAGVGFFAGCLMQL